MKKYWHLFIYFLNDLLYQPSFDPLSLLQPVLQAVGDGDGPSSGQLEWLPVVAATAAAVAAADLHNPLLFGSALRVPRALRERSGGVQRPGLPDRDKRPFEPGKLHGPAAGGEPHHCAGQQH